MDMNTMQNVLLPGLLQSLSVISVQIAAKNCRTKHLFCNWKVWGKIMVSFEVMEGHFLNSNKMDFWKSHWDIIYLVIYLSKRLYQTQNTWWICVHLFSHRKPTWPSQACVCWFVSRCSSRSFQRQFRRPGII